MEITKRMLTLIIGLVVGSIGGGILGFVAGAISIGSAMDGEERRD